MARLQIIIKNERKYLGKRRSELESNLRKDGKQTMSLERLDQLEFIERKLERK